MGGQVLLIRCTIPTLDLADTSCSNDARAQEPSLSTEDTLPCAPIKTNRPGHLLTPQAQLHLAT